MSNSKYLLSLAIALAFTGCTQIDTGNVGVERAFGKVSPDPKPQGVYATMFDSVDEFTTKEVSFQVNDLAPKSRDNLTLKDLDVDVYYKVTPKDIPRLYVKYAGDYIRHGDIVNNSNNPDVLVMGYNRVLRGAREAVYNAVSKFDATTMHTQRAEMGEEIRKELQKELDASDKGSFTVTTVNVRNLLTDPGIEQAIRDQVATDQMVIKKKKEIAIAQAESERLEALATGQARANELLNNSLTPSVMRIRLAEMQRDTIIASAKKGNVIISGEATPLVQVQ